jgi:hypothetical protein
MVADASAANVRAREAERQPAVSTTHRGRLDRQESASALAFTDASRAGPTALLHKSWQSVRACKWRPVRAGSRNHSGRTRARASFRVALRDRQ